MATERTSVAAPGRDVLELLPGLFAFYADEFDWRREVYEFESTRLAIDLLLGRTDLRPGLEAGKPLDELQALWHDDLIEFNATRERFLLY